MLRMAEHKAMLAMRPETLAVVSGNCGFLLFSKNMKIPTNDTSVPTGIVMNAKVHVRQETTNHIIIMSFLCFQGSGTPKLY